MTQTPQDIQAQIDALENKMNALRNEADDIEHEIDNLWEEKHQLEDAIMDDAV